MTGALPPAVVFDWDNTLIDTFPLLKEAHNRVRRAMGVPEWNDEEARANIRLAARDAFPRLYGTRGQEAEDLFYAHVREHHLGSLSVMEGAAELVHWLAGAGAALGVVSNKRGEILRAEVAHLGWAPYFPAVIGPDDVGHAGKPKPDGLLAALAILGIPESGRARSWYVGDTENDLRTGHAAGVLPVYIENHRMSHPEVIALEKPAFQFRNCGECLDYLRALR